MRQKERVKHCSHCFFWVAAMTYVQCFVMCSREEGPRAVTALYFGWLAFRNRHLVISGAGGGGGWLPPPPPPIISIPGAVFSFIFECNTSGHRRQSGPALANRYAGTSPAGGVPRGSSDEGADCMGNGYQ